MIQQQVAAFVRANDLQFFLDGVTLRRDGTVGEDERENMNADSSESDPFDFMERLSECPTPVEMSEAVKVAANVSPEFEMIVRRMAFQIDRMTVSGRKGKT